ncbi:16S rRNA (guanine(966)-N(2))-methyltransferase RsmD [Thermanaeromonas toyohensis ToBE]|uniref:16S rRNA (Guanine(966)-N(2))-methyltransferase RsmD n=1 Tax=Thermanaeromonas toyohensis ToBE TaxID=698762 RepID=A0A1W1VNA4_9FIRM|nr:16S rRNA (guanine(966)-N(2))-methyltransferase RsmD [Thermanaeromonas toyohensis]SMB94763.1 16S rRNA (guanine(966)-N(2))-methyltransferase RsmD [Thermanaeromonas toyohensis ToBE]
MLRIIGGIARGRQLKVPRGSNIRPTSARVREALFNIVQVEGKSFLDVFAGAGGVGLEALSRGARGATFIENHPLALKALRENLILTGFTDRAEVIGQDALRAGQRLLEQGYRFDIIFLDPPYEKGLAEKVVPILGELLSPDGWLILESRSREVPPEIPGAALVDERRYGDSALRFYRKVVEERGEG